jgi:peptide/nickel transport system substrate-binding protein
MRKALCAAALAAMVMAAPAGAKTFRWANEADVDSLDPYVRQETFLLSFDSNIYEPLVRRDRNLRLEPALATRWSQPALDVWRFTLRRGVAFQDGTPFGADDVLFSFERANGPGSRIASAVATIKEARKVDDHTVEFVTNGPDPLLPEEIAVWDMMSKAWCEKNDAARAADIAKAEENYASSHANGTGPFMLRSRQPGAQTVLVRNPDWWDRPEHDLDQVVFRPIADPAARSAALIAGDIDMVYGVSAKEIEAIAKAPHLRLIHGPELRTIYLGFAMGRGELQMSSVKGKNPFQDIRVRKAFYQAIDENAIKTKVMRGFATPTALMIGPGVNGFDPKLNQRLPFDQAAAKKLLAEAGYPNGFEVAMDCPNDRYVNDEDICQAAVAMLSRVGIKVNLLAQTKTKFFTKINYPAYDTPFFMLGWTPATYDAHNMLVSLMHTRTPNGGGAGLVNIGGYSNKTLDDLIDKIQIETDKAKREALVSQALTIVKDDIPTIPLHQQAVVWATRDNISLTQLADNFFPFRYVTVK